MTVPSTLPHRHPAYIAGAERCEKPTGHGNPYPLGSDDYMMFSLGFADMYASMQALGETEIEEITE